MMPDLRFHNEGTLIGLTILTPRARAWVEDNCVTEPWQFMGATLWIDHGCASDVIDGAMADGLEVTA